MNIVAVTFQGTEKHYYYNTPYEHKKGELLAVNVSGTFHVVKVVSMITRVDIDRPLKTIVGVVLTLADLEQPIVTRKPSLMETLVEHFT